MSTSMPVSLQVMLVPIPPVARAALLEAFGNLVALLDSDLNSSRELLISRALGDVAGRISAAHERDELSRAERNHFLKYLEEMLDAGAA